MYYSDLLTMQWPQLFLTLATISSALIHMVLWLKILCSDVDIQITDSELQNTKMDVSLVALNLEFSMLTNNSVLIVEDTVFSGYMSVSTCYDLPCDENNLHCSRNFMKFTRITVTSGIFFDIGSVQPTKNCTVFIEDSTFSGSYATIRFHFGYNSSNSEHDTSTQAVLRNVTFANNTIDKSAT